MPTVVPDRPRSLAVIAAVVALEAVLLLAVAVFYLVELAVATPDDVVRALVTAALALLSGAGLLLVARGLLRSRRSARAPALVTNLILPPVAIGLFQGGRWYVGAPLLAAAATVVVLLFSAGVTAALEHADADASD